MCTHVFFSIYYKCSDDYRDVHALIGQGLYQNGYLTFFQCYWGDICSIEETAAGMSYQASYQVTPL